MDLDLIPASELFSKSKIQLASQIQVGGGLYSVEAIIAKLEPLLLEERVEKIQKVVGKRSLKVMTVLEDIYDRGNVSAVMRTAESLGFFRFLILEKENAVLGNRELMGATNPKDAEENTIRKLYGISIDKNSVHGSDSLDNAKKEIDFFFKN